MQPAVSWQAWRISTTHAPLPADIQIPGYAVASGQNEASGWQHVRPTRTKLTKLIGRVSEGDGEGEKRCCQLATLASALLDKGKVARTSLFSKKASPVGLKKPREQIVICPKLISAKRPDKSCCVHNGSCRKQESPEAVH